MGFYSRPPLLAGDPAAWNHHPAALDCFNPRPPLLAGDPLRTQRLVGIQFFCVFART